MPIGAEKMTDGQRAQWLEKTASKKAGDVTLALAMLRDWANRHIDHPEVIDVLRAMDRCAADARSTVAYRAHDDLNSVMWAARHAGTLAALWERAVAAKLTRAAKALTPPSEQATGTAEGLANRLLARGEGAALRDELAGAKGARARELIGAIHDEASRKDVAADTVVVAVSGAVAHADAVVRYAAIDAAAIASASRPCDLSAAVPALVAAIADESKPEHAPASGTWQSSSIAWSARRALGHAVRWPASSAAAITALRPLLDARAKLPALQAAYALAWGTARRGEWTVVDELLASPKSAVREGALQGLTISYDWKRDLVEAPASLAPRITELRRDPVAAIVKLATSVVVAAGAQVGAADPRVLAEGLRSDSASERRAAIGLVKAAVDDPAIVPWLVDGLGTDERDEVLRLLATCRTLDAARWAPLLAGILLDGDWTSARRHAAGILDRIDTSGRPWHRLREVPR